MSKIVTGHTGSPHVSSSDDAAFNRAVVGTGDYILAGSDLTLQEEGLKIKLSMCEVLVGGHHGRIEGTEEVTIVATQQGHYRQDLIIAKYQVDGFGVESMTVEVKQGTASTSSKPAAPSLEQTDLYKFIGNREMALASIIVNGGQIVSKTIVAQKASSMGEVMSQATAAVASAVAPIQTKVNKIGDYSELALAADKTIASGKTAVVVSLVLPAGTYVLNGFSAWDKNSNGAVARVGIMTRAEFAEASSHFSERRNLLSSSGGTRMGCSDIMKLAAETEVCLAVYTSDKAVVLGNGTVHTTGIRAVRIA